MKIINIILITSALVGCASSGVPNVREELNGWWDWSYLEHSCTTNAQRYSFSPDGKQVLVYAPNGAAFGSDTPSKNLIYNIKSEIPHVLRMKGVGDVRKTDKGKLVAWDLVMKDSNTFCWHRADWKKSGCTKNLVRCNNIN